MTFLRLLGILSVCRTTFYLGTCISYRGGMNGKPAAVPTHRVHIRETNPVSAVAKLVHARPAKIRDPR